MELDIIKQWKKWKRTTEKKIIFQRFREEIKYYSCEKIGYMKWNYY